jgi:uncharacterized protein YbjT (DUF2867 family)
MTSTILVTGGTGTLGRLVVTRLRAAGRDVRVLSRRSHEATDGVAYVTGDLATGVGIDAAVDGVGTIVHCAGSATGDAQMTDNLVRAARRTGAPHLVYISVVGTDRIPIVGFGRLPFAYFRSKRDAERVLATSGLPWTTLRATQFYDLLWMVARALTKLPVVPAFAGFRFQPVDAGEVAARLVELAVGEAAGQVPDLGGPRVYRMADLLRIYLRATHRHRLIMPIWLPGTSARAFRAGGNLVAKPLAPGQVVGRRTWEGFLAERLRGG